MSDQNNKNSSPDQGIFLYQTFSAVFFPLLFIYLGLCSLIIYYLNLSLWQFSFQFKIILDISLLIVFLPFLYGLIPPYQKIEFTKKGLLMSFIHKFSFIITLPLLIVGLLLVEYIKRFYSLSSIIYFTFIYDFISVSIIIIAWVIFTELIWEFITNLFGIQTSRRIRKENLKANEQFGVNKNLINFIIHSEKFKEIVETSDSNRWQLLTVEIPILISVVSFLLYIYYLKIIILFLFLSGCLLFPFLYFLSAYRPFLIQHNISLNKWEQLNRKIFGSSDISSSVRNTSIVLMISVASLIPMALVFVKTNIFFFEISFLLYSVMLIIFVISIWSTKIFTPKEPILDLKTKSIIDQIQLLIKRADTKESIFQPSNSKDFYFRDSRLIQKILPYPFDTYNWIIFNFRNPLFNPFIIKELALVLEMDIELADFFSKELLSVFTEFDLKPWEQFNPEIEINNKLMQLYNFKVSNFQEKSQNKIFFFNFRNTFLLCDHSINPLIADNFMIYYDNFLKKKIYSSKIVQSISSVSNSFLEMEISNDLIYWNVSDQFLLKALIDDNNFLLEQRTLRKEIFKKQEIL